MQAIVACLKEILADVEAGRLVITDEYEDIHSFVEANLIDRLGDTGKKLCIPGAAAMTRWRSICVPTPERNCSTWMRFKGTARHDITYHGAEYGDDYAGFHPSAEGTADHAAHHMGAYFEMFKRDRLRLHDIYERMNYCPLGSGALAGTTYPLDRAYTAEPARFFTDRL